MSGNANSNTMNDGCIDDLVQEMANGSGASDITLAAAGSAAPTVDGEEENSSTRKNGGGIPLAAPDPFDPMSLGISTDYAASINSRSSTKGFELRKPNDQEFVRTSSRKDHRLVVGALVDKQDMSRVYVVGNATLLAEVKAKHPKAVRGMELVVTQSLAGGAILWPVPLAEDRGGKWNSTHRAACDQARTRWTNMVTGQGQYELHTVDNPREVDWDSLPPFRDILEQAISERLIDSLDHPLLRKLRGEID